MSTSYKGQSRTVRLSRACDLCKRKKKKCAGPVAELQGSCLPCVQSDAECTFLRPAKTGDYRNRTVTELQERIRELEGLIAQLDPRPRLSCDLPSSQFENRNTRITYSAVQPASTDDNRGQQEEERGNWWDSEDKEASASPESLSDRLARLRLNPLGADECFGDASSFKMAQHMARIQPKTPTRFSSELRPYRRLEYWSPRPWETSDFGLIPEGSLSYTFPEPDLLHKLNELFFSEINAVFPLLHQPTFLSNVERGLHHHDSSFAELLLCVCASSACYIDDPRVLLPGGERTSAGWKWFHQVGIARKVLLVTVNLYDMQAIYLSLHFMTSSSLASLAWTVLGTTLRRAQDFSLDRRKTYKSNPNADDEQWKRAFWLFVFADRGLAFETGRACVLNNQDIDAPLPIECDDEYWEGQTPFQQPVGVPSRLSAFIMLSKLKQIEGHALCTILAANKAAVAEGSDQKAWERSVLAQLTSDLNSWLISVPSHLSWESQPRDPIFFKQSAHLHLHYHYLLITIHRPFLLSAGKVAPDKTPDTTAFAVCSNAAQSSISIIERLECETMPTLGICCLFTAAVVLLLTSLVAKCSNPNADVSHHMLRVEKCFRMLMVLETRNILAGRFRDLLMELASTGNVPLSPHMFTTSHSHSGGSSPANHTWQDLSSTDHSSPSNGIAPTFDHVQAGRYGVFPPPGSDPASLPRNHPTPSTDYMFGINVQPGSLHRGESATGHLHASVQPEEACSHSIDEQLDALWQDALINESPSDWQSAMQALQWSGAGPVWYEPASYEGSLQ